MPAAKDKNLTSNDENRREATCGVTNSWQRWWQSLVAVTCVIVLLLWMQAAGLFRHRRPEVIVSPTPTPVATGAPIASVPAGVYVAAQINDAKSNYDLAALIALVKYTGQEDARIVLTLDGHGGAMLDVFGEREAITYDEQFFYSTAAGMQSAYRWDGGRIITEQDGSQVIFVPETDYVEPQADEQTLRTLEKIMNEGVEVK